MEEQQELEKQVEEEKTVIEAPKVKRTYKKKIKEQPEEKNEVGLKGVHLLEEPPIKMPKPRTEAQKLQFMKVQARRQEICLQKRMEKNAKIKEIVLKQLDIEKRNKALNKRKIMKISNSIIDDEFKQNDKDILKKIIEKQKETIKTPIIVDYTRFF